MATTEQTDLASSDNVVPIVFWERFEALLVRLGDRLNPILVKETRQALKSRQFVVTFCLVLVASWIWTILGLAILGPRVHYAAHAGDMFYGYYAILTFPLALIVPFFAYRSLAAEQEDNTYELMSITTLSPRQIIAGKLASAVIQMLVYFSAVAPCLAFTYVLRGIDIITIGVLLYYAFFGSIGLSLVGLFAATITTVRYVQVLISVLVILGCAFVYFVCVLFGTFEFLAWSTNLINDDDFLIGNGIILTIYVTDAAMVFLAAAAQITFTSANRSSALRWGMLVQHACIAGWVAFFCFYISPDRDAIFVLSTLLGIHWYIMGTLMTGESPLISNRVKRSLPQGEMGRLFLTWFNPGPATGYMFAVINLVSGMALGILMFGFFSSQSAAGLSWNNWLQAFYFMTLSVCYVAFYLGLGNLLLNRLRRYAHTFLFTSVVVQFGLLVAFCGVPLVIHLMSPGMRRMDYTLLQALDPFWSLGYLADRGWNMAWECHALMFIIPPLAVVVLLANLPAILKEVRQVRIAQPQRILEDEAALEAAKWVPTNPWDLPDDLPNQG